MTINLFTCPNCQGVGGAHNYPCQGMFPQTPQWHVYPPTPGAIPLKQLTEEDVRRIVREELARNPRNYTIVGGENSR